MSSFLTTQEKSAINAVFDNLHDTFARTITVYKNAQDVTVISSDYNHYYKRNSDGDPPNTTTTVSSEFSARILYGKPDSSFLADSQIDSQLRLEILSSTVRLKVNQEARDYLVEAKRVEFDNNIFKINADPRPIGMFTPEYYTFFLTPTEKDNV
jgi:hypothetical protein